jgi:hypothetical protein
MGNENLIIPIDASGLFSPDKDGPVRGGGTRIVPSVSIPGVGNVPCIWRSSKIIQAVLVDGHPAEPAYECIILLGKEPAHAMRAVIGIDGFRPGPQEFPKTTVEW